MSILQKALLAVLFLFTAAVVADGVYTAYVICCYESPGTRQIRQIIKDAESIERRNATEQQP